MSEWDRIRIQTERIRRQQEQAWFLDRLERERWARLTPEQRAGELRARQAALASKEARTRREEEERAARIARRREQKRANRDRAMEQILELAHPFERMAAAYLLLADELTDFLLDRQQEQHTLGDPIPARVGVPLYAYPALKRGQDLPEGFLDALARACPDISPQARRDLPFAAPWPSRDLAEWFAEQASIHTVPTDGAWEVSTRFPFPRTIRVPGWKFIGGGVITATGLHDPHRANPGRVPPGMMSEMAGRLGLDFQLEKNRFIKPAPALAAREALARVERLATLRDAGVLSDVEFESVRTATELARTERRQDVPRSEPPDMPPSLTHAPRSVCESCGYDNVGPLRRCKKCGADL